MGQPHMIVSELPSEVEHRELIAGELRVEHHQQPDPKPQREAGSKSRPGACEPLAPARWEGASRQSLWRSRGRRWSAHHGIGF